MSLHNDLDIAADIADILAYGQRAQMLENQALQLTALKDLQYQAQVQAIRVEHEKALQDLLFSLRKSLPNMQPTIQNNSRKALSELFHAERMMEFVPPHVFTGLEWKEYASSTRSELDSVIEQLRVAHGDSIIVELSDMLSKARAQDEETRQAKITAENFAKWKVINQERHDKRIKLILSCINVLGIIFLLFTCLFFYADKITHFGKALFVELVIVFSLNIFLPLIIPAPGFPTNKSK